MEEERAQGGGAGLRSDFEGSYGGQMRCEKRLTDSKVVAFSSQPCLMLLTVGMFVSLCGHCYLWDGSALTGSC